MTERKNSPTEASAERELVITRVFGAPRDLVWKAWTDPERVKRWWGPKNFTAPVCKIEVSPHSKLDRTLKTKHHQWPAASAPVNIALGGSAISLGKEKGHDY